MYWGKILLNSIVITVLYWVKLDFLYSDLKLERTLSYPEQVHKDVEM